MRRTIGVLAAALVCTAGCAQMLGLDGYGAAGADGGGPDGSADTATADRTVDGQGGDQQSPGDATVDGGADSAGGGDDTGTTDAPADTTSASDARDSSDNGFDAGADAGCPVGTTCTPPVPNGWTGPLALWTGTSGAPTCGAGFAPVFDGGSPSKDPAQCTCKCDNPTNVVCSAPKLTFTKMSGCRGATCGSSPSIPENACTSLTGAPTSGCGGAINVTVSGSTAGGGSCVPIGTSNVPPWTWTELAVACAPSAQSPMACGPGGQCTTTPAMPFNAYSCVIAQGSVGCPGGGYSVQHVYATGAQDSRGCSSCTCPTPPTGVDCNANAQIDFWSSTGCDAGSSLPAVGLPQSCLSPAFAPQGVTFSTTPSGGSCNPVGGTATGAVNPQGTVTICCTQ
jgi:hypothetical protein